MFPSSRRSPRPQRETRRSTRVVEPPCRSSSGSGSTMKWASTTPSVPSSRCACPLVPLSLAQKRKDGKFNCLARFARRTELPRVVCLPARRLPGAAATSSTKRRPPVVLCFQSVQRVRTLKCQAGFSFSRRCAAPAGVVGPAFLERVKDAREMRRFRVNRVCAHRGARSPSSMTASGRELIRTASRSSSSS